MQNNSWNTIWLLAKQSGHFPFSLNDPHRHHQLSTLHRRYFCSAASAIPFTFWKNPGQKQGKPSTKRQFVSSFGMSADIGIVFGDNVGLSLGCLHALVDCDVVGMFW